MAQVVGTLALAFERFPLRKVVAHLPAENAARLGGLHQVADHVGTLVEHVLIEGTYADVAIFETTRADFERTLAGRLGAALQPVRVPDDPRPGRTADSSGAGDPRELAAALAAFDAWVDSLHWLEVLDLVETALGRAVDPEALRAGESLVDIRRFLADHLAEAAVPRDAESGRRDPPRPDNTPPSAV